MHAGQIALKPSTMTMLGYSPDYVVPWHPPFIASLVDCVAVAGPASASASDCGKPGHLLTTVLRELLLSLFHVNSILSALASNTPSLRLSPSSSLLLVVYVDVRACANKYYRSLTHTERSQCSIDRVMQDVHALFGSLRLCAVQYIEKFVASVTGCAVLCCAVLKTYIHVYTQKNYGVCDC